MHSSFSPSNQYRQTSLSPNLPFDGLLGGRAPLMTDRPKKVIYDFYFQTADANSQIASVKIKASISERPLNAGLVGITRVSECARA